MEFNQIILTPFSWLLTVLTKFSNYGVALILFAVVVKLILFPFSLKSKRSMIQQTMVQDKVQRIQKQYANNREKMNEEVQKLYAKENINPMSGCLWSFIPLLILWPLYAVIRRPLYHMMGQSEAAIEAIKNVLGFEVGTGTSAAYSEMYMASMMNDGNMAQLKAAVDGVSAGLGDKLFEIDFMFLGMDLSQIAQWKIWQTDWSWAAIGLFLLPIISAVLSFLMSKVSQMTNSLNKNQANNQMNSSMKSMFIMMPLMSLWIGYAMPAGLCIYWIINNVLAMVQEVVSARMLRKDYAKAAAKREEQERLEKEEEKRKKREAAERRAKAIEDAKNNKGKKKQPVEKPEKKKDRTTDVGRIGMRPYARGRSYDPDRFGGVTVYQDPGAPIDEVAVAEALAAKGMLQEEEPAQIVNETPVEEVVEQVEAGVTEIAEVNEAEVVDTEESEEEAEVLEEDAHTEE